MSRLHTMIDRYQNDTEFGILVDTLYAIILRLDMTPSEVRECAMLACVKAESDKPASWRISVNDAEEFAQYVRAMERHPRPRPDDCVHPSYETVDGVDYCEACGLFRGVAKEGRR